MKISLVGLGFKTLSVFLSLWIGMFSYAIIFLADEKSIFLSIFVTFVFTFCVFGIYIAFSYKILLYDDYMILQRPFKKKIAYNDVEKIYCIDDDVESSIYIKLEASEIRMSGYMVLFNKKKRFKITQRIANEINDYIAYKK